MVVHQLDYSIKLECTREDQPALSSNSYFLVFSAGSATYVHNWLLIMALNLNRISCCIVHCYDTDFPLVLQ